jgi:hypothetical protein
MVLVIRVGKNLEAERSVTWLPASKPVGTSLAGPPASPPRRQAAYRDEKPRRSTRQGLRSGSGRCRPCGGEAPLRFGRNAVSPTARPQSLIVRGNGGSAAPRRRRACRGPAQERDPEKQSGGVMPPSSACFTSSRALEPRPAQPGRRTAGACSCAGASRAPWAFAGDEESLRLGAGIVKAKRPCVTKRDRPRAAASPVFHRRGVRSLFPLCSLCLPRRRNGG